MKKTLFILLFSLLFIPKTFAITYDKVVISSYFVNSFGIYVNTDLYGVKPFLLGSVYSQNATKEFYEITNLNFEFLSPAFINSQSSKLVDFSLYSYVAIDKTAPILSLCTNVNCTYTTERLILIDNRVPNTNPSFFPSTETPCPEIPTCPEIPSNPFAYETPINKTSIFSYATSSVGLTSHFPFSLLLTIFIPLFFIILIITIIKRYIR